MSSRQTIERLYNALANLDAASMEACYAENARFDDEVFTLAGRRQIGAMWRMLCSDARLRGIGQWKLELGDIRTSASKGRVHWEVHYRFGRRERQVHNRVEAKFDFDEQGLIVRHRDRFDFWRWTRQALGLQGWLLGWSPRLRERVRLRAARQLQHYMEKNR